MELSHPTFIGIKCLALSDTFIRSQKAIRIIALVPAVFQVLPKTVQLARRGGKSCAPRNFLLKRELGSSGINQGKPYSWVGNL